MGIRSFIVRPYLSMVMSISYWLLVIGYWLLVIGYWLLVIGYWLGDIKVVVRALNHESWLLAVWMGGGALP
jgi:hypothetical protein